MSDNATGQDTPAHVDVSWPLSCGHAVVCGCTHEIGSNVYCPYCGTNKVVLRRELIPKMFHSSLERCTVARSHDATECNGEHYSLSDT